MQNVLKILQERQDKGSHHFLPFYYYCANVGCEQPFVFTIYSKII